jgi:hypothetical protein
MFTDLLIVYLHIMFIIRHEKGTQQERNKKRYDGACLKFKDPYTRENPVAPTLEHPHSWKLAGYDANGLPASKEASTEVLACFCIRFFFI